MMETSDYESLIKSVSVYLNENDLPELARRLRMEQSELRAQLQEGILPPRLIELVLHDWRMMRDMLLLSENGSELMAEILSDAFKHEQVMNPDGFKLLRALRALLQSIEDAEMEIRHCHKL